MFGDETVEFVVVFQPYMESIRFKLYFSSYLYAGCFIRTFVFPPSCILCRLSLSMSLY